MANPAKIINTMMRALVHNHFGCLDAAAATINDATGGSVCKGTVSKRMNGSGWPMQDIMALEDAAGVYPVTRFMARRMSDIDIQNACLMTLTTASIKEAGESHAAALRVIQSNDANDAATAVRKADEAVAAAKRLLDALDQ